jgi:hypothetical protein
MHDPRLGRFFAVDPLAPEYPHNSPYAFSENVVINAVELEGLEKDLLFWSDPSLAHYRSTKSHNQLVKDKKHFERGKTLALATGGAIAIGVVDNVFLGGTITKITIAYSFGTMMHSAQMQSYYRDRGQEEIAKTYEAEGAQATKELIFEGGLSVIFKFTGKLISVTKTLRKGESGPTLELFRGTDRYLELKNYDETGYILSDAAAIKYAETKNIDEALKYADEVHQKWIKEFGSIEEYAKAHSKYGVKLEEMYGMPRTLISASDKEATAIYFAKEGQVFSGKVDPNTVFQQKLETSTESEYIFPVATQNLKD